MSETIQNVIPQNVILIDERPLVRAGHRAVLASIPGARVTGEAGSGTDGLRLAELTHVDVVVLDVALPDRSPFELIDTLRRRHPGLRALVTGPREHETLALRALRAGASAFVSLSSPLEQVAAALRAVVAGDAWVSPEVAAALALGFQRGATVRPPHDDLSDRELEVLLSLAAGQSVGEVARVLCLSPKTVSTYRTRVLRKLQVRSNAELAAYALRAGLNVT